MDDAGSARRQRVTELFTTLDKLVRSLKIYAGKGALVDRLLAETGARLTQAMEGGDLELSVASQGLLLGDGLVTPQDAAPPYVFRLFCDGVRELSFHVGLDVAELRRFAEILGADPIQSPDMVSLLEAGDLPHIDYYAADSLAQGKGPAVKARESLAVGGGRMRRGRARGEGRRIALTADEMRSLVLSEAEGWLAEAHTPVRAEGAVAARAEAVRAQFRAKDDVKRFLAIAFGGGPGENPSPLVLSYYDAALASGDVPSLVALHTFAAVAAAKGDERALSLRRALLDEARRPTLAPLVKAHPEALLPPLKAAPGPVAPELTQLIILLPMCEAREGLRACLEGAGLDLTAFYRLGLASDDLAVVLDAVERLAKSGSPEAADGLVAALGSNLTVVRKAALTALSGRTTRAALTAISRAVRDPDRENRLLALRLLGAAGDSRVVPMLLSAAEDPALKDRDDEEQAAVFAALAAYDDNRIVTFLAELLGEKNLTRQRFQLNRQIMAARSLGAIGTELAMRTLEDQRSRWYHAGPVKDAVTAAISAGAR